MPILRRGFQVSILAVEVAKENDTFLTLPVKRCPAAGSGQIGKLMAGAKRPFLTQRQPAKASSTLPVGERPFRSLPHAPALPPNYLFDYLVGGRQQRRWHGEAERPCGLQIYRQLEFRRLNDGEIGRLGTLEDLAGINADLAIHVTEAGSIADQAPGT